MHCSFTKEIREKGFDSLFFINGLDSICATSWWPAIPRQCVSSLRQATRPAKRFAKVAAKRQPTFIYNAISLCNKADLDYRTASNKQLLVELTLIKLCQLLSPSPHESGAGEGQLRPIKPYRHKRRRHNDSHHCTATYSLRPTGNLRKTDRLHRNSRHRQPPLTGITICLLRRPCLARLLPCLAARCRSSVVFPDFQSPIQRGNTQSSDNAAVNPQTSAQQRSEKFTDEEFAAEARQQIIDSHPTEQLLTNAMRNARPRRHNEYHFIATAESEAIEGSHNIEPRHAAWRTAQPSQNDMVQLSIELNKGAGHGKHRSPTRNSTLCCAKNVPISTP